MTGAWTDRHIAVADGSVRVIERGTGPVVLFAHATGMCADVYAPMLAPLAERFCVIAFDARGHGSTRLPATSVNCTEWLVFRDDLMALVGALAVRPALLAGHSFGATVAALAAAARPGIADRLLLMDPAFIPRAEADGWRRARDGGHPPPNPMAERAARRRASFASRAEAAGAWRDRGVFAGWPEDAFAAYLGHALGDREDGSVGLSCPPEFEAAVFHGVSTALEDALGAATVPVHLMAAASGTVPDGFGQGLAPRPHHFSFERLPGTGHFFPVTHPDAVRAAIAACP